MRSTHTSRVFIVAFICSRFLSALISTNRVNVILFSRIIVAQVHNTADVLQFIHPQRKTKNTQGSKVGRLRICQLWKFEWNRRGTESKKREKWGKKKKINAAATGNQTRDLSITDHMSAWTNQVHLKIQFRHRFDQKSQITDSLHRLGSFFARTSSVPLEMIDTINFDFAFFNL